MLGFRQRGSRSPRYKNRLLRPEVALRAFEIDGIVVVDTMSEIRELRQRMGLSQQQCAALLDVAVETFLPWDSGRRRAPTAALQRARATVAEYARQHEPLSLDQLASELGTVKLTRRERNNPSMIRCPSLFSRRRHRIPDAERSRSQ